MLKKMLTKKLNQNTESKVLLKLLVVLKAVGKEALVEANLLKDVVLKLLVVLKAMVEQADVEDLGDKEAVHNLCVKLLLFQAILLVDLSQASKAKLKLIKVKAVDCKGEVEALVFEAPPETKPKQSCCPVVS